MITRNPPKRTAQATSLDVSKLAAAAKKMFGPDSVNVPGKDADFMLRRMNTWIDVGKFNQVMGSETKGIPCGYYTEVGGNEGAGKSTLGYYLLAQAQAQGYIAWLADVEHSFDTKWATKQGIDINNLLVIETAYENIDQKIIVDNADQQFAKWEKAIYKGWDLYHKPQLLLIDSLAAMLPREQLEGDYGERSVGALARAMAVNLPKFQTALLETKTACIFVNQLRDAIGVMFGEKENTTGGRAKNYYFSSRVTVKRVKVESKSNIPYRMISRVKNKKNKIDQPFREAELIIDFSSGIVV